MPTIYDPNVKWFEDWKKKMGLDVKRRNFRAQDIRVRPLVNVPESKIKERIPVEGRYVCDVGEHILIHFDLGVLVVSDE